MSKTDYLYGCLAVGGISEASRAGFQKMLSRQHGIITPRKSENSNFRVATDAKYLYEDEELFFASTGNPYWRNLDLEWNDKQADFAKIFVDLYRRSGCNFIHKLAGGFSFVLYDKAVKKLMLGIDRVGQKSLYYAWHDGNIIFAHRADIVAAFSDTLTEYSNQSIFDYIYFHSIPSPQTIYKHINKLSNGQYVIYQDGVREVCEYWQPEFSERTDRSVQELSQEMFDVIKKSVMRLGKDDYVGTFLSGGLDSSTVTGMLSRVKTERVKSFSIGFNVSDYDEIDYARTAASHFSTEQHEYYVTPQDVVDTVTKVASFYDEPFGNSSALPAYFCARMAKQHGIRRLLAGDGGDELFAGNERYSKQQVFEVYNKIPGIVRYIILDPLFQNNRYVRKIPILKKINSYIAQANVPLPDRLETYNFLHRHAADEIFRPEFISDINTQAPLNNMRDTYNQLPGLTPLNRMLWLDWKKTLHDNDLVKVNRMCELAGLEVVYPLLDDELVEFSCRIPSDMKLRNGKLRWFYKSAISGFLPDKIIHKQKHGFGLPFGIWTSEHKELQELAYSSLKALKRRKIFRDEFIDNTINMHQSVHAKFYGELVWLLMMLELWFSRS